MICVIIKNVGEEQCHTSYIYDELTVGKLRTATIQIPYDFDVKPGAIITVAVSKDE